MNAPANQQFARQPLGRVAPNRAFLLCPHCATPMIIRDSERITETVKHLYVHCTNVDCAFTAKWGVSPIHEISPSQMARPDIDIPPCPHDYVRRAAERRRGEPDPDQLIMFPDATERIEPLVDPAPA